MIGTLLLRPAGAAVAGVAVASAAAAHAVPAAATATVREDHPEHEDHNRREEDQLRGRHDPLLFLDAPSIGLGYEGRVKMPVKKA